ncbi:MAG: hypothetical protein J5545_04030 [Bacteroidaceae bacterium]|nr:hypothetical protein [Bacteroidaceae bacterium]
MKNKGFLWPLLLLAAALIGSFCVQGCKSDDGPSLAELLPGKWYLQDYTIVVDGDSSTYLTVDYFVFGTNGRFHVYDLYQTDVLDSGKYEAGNDYIRFEYERGDEDYLLLWSVQSFSEKEVLASYHDQSSKRDIQASVKIGKEKVDRTNK